MNKKLILVMIIFAGLLAGSCQQPSNIIANVGEDQLNGEVHQAQTVMNEKEMSSPVGNWQHSIAPEYWMTITNSPKGLTVNWEPTLDSDISISGELASKGANVFHGDVHFISGDEEKNAQLTLRFDGVGRTLSMEFPTLFEDSLVFRPAGGGQDCQMKAQAIVENLPEFKALLATYPELGLMDESEAEGHRLYEFRVFVKDEADELHTVGRFKIDFEEGKALQYDVVEGDYNELKSAEKAVASAACK